MTANIVVPRQAHDAPRHLWSSLMTIQPSDKVLSIRQTAAVMNLSVRTLERLCQSGSGPRKILLSPGRVGFRERDVVAWIDGRPVSPTRSRPRSDERLQRRRIALVPLHSDFDSLDGPSRPTRAPMDRADQPVKITVQRY
jgi:predicted DNA-binding transcriptional regulator AlpA